MGKVNDLTGKRYGKLLVLRRGEDRYTKSGRRLITWICLCDCGNEIQVDANNLRNGNTTSCGCKTPCIDLKGMRFGKLEVLERVENNYRGDAMWKCKCDCGNETIVVGKSLRNGSTKSCGCGIVKGLQKGWEATKTHGMSKSRIYRIWCAMKKRTSCTADERHKRDYYDRGIRTCKEWRDSFEAFYEWAINNGYRDDLSIDRKNNDGNYCPENCRWVNNQAQSCNTRRNRNYTYKGKTQNIAQWAKEYGVPDSMLRERLVILGWSIEKALETPSGKKVVK